MKYSVLLVLMMAAPAMIRGQDAATVDALKNELRELRQRTEQLEEKLKRLDSPPPPAAAAPPSTNAPAAPPPEKWTPAAPMTLVRGQNSYMNLSLVGLFAAGGSTASDLDALQTGGHDPIQRGFTVQNVEATFEGVVDPYLRAQANIIFLMDRNSETALELEEAWLETTGLPASLTLRAGQLFTDFGRINPAHPHTWSFVDSPLVNARLLGPDGLRNPGARLSWLTPTPFYSELSFSVQNPAGETASSFRSHDGEAYLGRLSSAGNLRGPGDLLFAPRYAMSFDLTPAQTLLLGASGAFAPNGSSPNQNTEIYGLDLFWKWKPVSHHSGFPFVSWQTEAMLRRFHAGAFSEDLDGDGVIDFDINNDALIDAVPRELLKDWGLYTQVAYGFRKGWVAALRFDYVDRLNKGAYELVYGDDAERSGRWRFSPNLTWYPSEFSKIRLQYNLDDRRAIGMDHSVWLQFEFLLGAHGAHKF